MLLRIEGRGLPGMAGVRVAVQAKDKPGELLDPQRGDADAVAWELPVDVLAAGAESGVLTARLRLTDAKGQPLAARVLPPHVEWTAG